MLQVSTSGYFEHCRGKNNPKPSRPGASKLPIAQNLLERNFMPKAPNQVWTSHITYIATDEGWLYLTGVIDLFSRQVLGWSMGTTCTPVR